jgi:hypothetical protein
MAGGISVGFGEGVCALATTGDVLRIVLCNPDCCFPSTFLLLDVCGVGGIFKEVFSL